MRKVWLAFLWMLLVGPSAGPVIVGANAPFFDFILPDTGAAETMTADGQGVSSGTIGGGSIPGSVGDSVVGEGLPMNGALLQLARDVTVGSGDVMIGYGDCNYGVGGNYNGDCNHASGSSALAGLPFLSPNAGGTGDGGQNQIIGQIASGYGLRGYGSNYFGANTDGGYGGTGLGPGVSGSGGGSRSGGDPGPLTLVSSEPWPPVSECLVCGPGPSGPGPGSGPGRGPGLVDLPSPLITGPVTIDFDPDSTDAGGGGDPTVNDPLILASVPEPHGLVVFATALACLAWVRRREPGQRYP